MRALRAELDELRGLACDRLDIGLEHRMASDEKHYALRVQVDALRVEVQSLRARLDRWEPEQPPALDGTGLGVGP